MKRIIILLLVLNFLGPYSHAQLPDGSISPNWTGTDLNGVSWNLYDILSQGKSAMIDFSATWCSPCWSFHQSGVTEQLWDLYGPGGTDELVVFTIEGDPRTNVDCIYDLPGCNNTTWGDWTEGVSYPFINDDMLADLYEITAWPTLFFICPNLQLTEIHRPTSAAAIYNMIGNCAQPFGTNNAGIVQYEAYEGEFCQQIQYSPEAKLQNLGSADITSLTVDLLVDMNVVETFNWNGTLETYEMVDIEFSELTLSETSVVQIEISAVNGAADDDNSNNLISTNLGPAIVSNDNYITLDLMTDDYPLETYWELRDGNNNALYTGGNIGIFADPAYVHEDAYLNERVLYSHQLPVPDDGCFNFVIYDFYGDGIQEFGGYYRITDTKENILQSGGDFGSIDEKLFQIQGSAMQVLDNAAIVLSQGTDADFCGSEMFSPSILFQNVGANNITELSVQASNSTNVLSLVDWTGNVDPGMYGQLTFDPFEISYTDPTLNFNIVSVNNVTDMYDYKNVMNRTLGFPQVETDKQMLTLNIQTDSYGYETYWQISDYSGIVIASGGNLNVGPNGGGEQTATPAGPGAYGNNIFITEQIILPGIETDCFEFLIVDDWGDGFIDGNGIQRGSFSLEEEDGTVLFSGSSNVFSALVGSFTAEVAEPIPIRLLNFEAFAIKNHVMLEWQSTSEYNNYGFEVYHSSDSRSWDRIGFVDASKTPNEINEYHLEHKTPQKGINYYQLKQLDHDGKYSYSPVRSVRLLDEDMTRNFRIYPTITDNQVLIEPINQIDGPLEVSLINMNSQVIFQKSWEGMTSAIELNLNAYSSGMYVLLLQYKDGYQKEHVVKL